MKALGISLLAAVLLAPAARAQAGPHQGGHELSRLEAGPQQGGHELAVWTGGGRGLTGSTSDTGVWSLGGRFGWILTGPAGPAFLRGRFEYALDAVPAFLVLQGTGTTYGAGFNPIVLKWNLVQRRSVSPYLEIAGGTLFTQDKTPPGTSRVNFTSGAAFGLHFLRSRYNWSAEVRYLHISNAGLAAPNPGINTIQFRLGFGRFTHPH